MVYRVKMNQNFNCYHFLSKMFMQYRNHLQERREFVLLIVDVGGKGDEVNLNNFLVFQLERTYSLFKKKKKDLLNL